MRIDLDRSSVGARCGVHVEAERLGKQSAARRIEQWIAGIRRVGARVELLEVAIERGLRGPVTVLGLDDQRGIEGDKAVVADILGDGVDDARVILGDSDIEQAAVGGDDRDPGLLLLTPRQVQSNEVHAATLPHPGRKL